MSTKTLPSKTRRSKSDIQSEFNQIRENLIEEKQERTLKDEDIERFREKEIAELTQNITAESIVQRIGTTELEISKALSGLSAQLLGESKLLQSLKEAVQFEQKELERLHQIDVAKTALEQLIEEYAEKKTHLDKEMEEARAQWTVEWQQKEKEQKQFEEELKRQRQREKDAYDYDQAQERKERQDHYEEAQRVQERQNQEKQETLEKSWASREATLKDREEELARLRSEVAAFPERLKKEIDRAVAETTKALQIEHKQAVVLAQKDAESEKRLAEQKVASLEGTVARQAEEIKGLAARVEEAKNQVQEIAIKAIEGASGAKALSHINQIAMEQAKTRSPQS